MLSIKGKPVLQSEAHCKRFKPPSIGLYQMKTYGKTKDIKYKKLLIGEDLTPCNKTEIEKMQEFSNYFKHPINTVTPTFISSKAAKKKANKSNSKPILQSVLNIGQKRIVQKCKDCLMEYNLFNMDDLSLHKKYHASVINALHWNVRSFIKMHSDLHCSQRIWNW